MPWEDYLQRTYGADARLPQNFKTFDFYDEFSGHAVSAKTLDTTTASRIAKPDQIYGTLKGYVDKISDFKNYQLGEQVLRGDMISKRTLDLAIPGGSNEAALQQITRAVQYSESQGIEVLVKVAQ